MHSVVVVGDVCIHEIHGDAHSPEQPVLTTVNGGAWMVEDAIRHALIEIKPPVTPLGMERDEKIAVREHWNLGATECRNTDNSGTTAWKYHVSSLSERNEGIYTGSGPAFGHTGKHSLKSAIENRSFEASNPSLPSDLHSKLEKSLPMQNQVIRKLCQVTSCPDVVVCVDLGYQALGKYRDNLYDELYQRMLDGVRRSEETHLPLMEPVIIYTLNYAQHKQNKLRDMLKDKSSFLHVLMHGPLAEHTVVVIDANDLRASELGISSGLSWERTAQDTVFELRRDEDFNCLLRLGQVIVRYSQFGALHIINKTPLWEYQPKVDGKPKTTLKPAVKERQESWSCEYTSADEPGGVTSGKPWMVLANDKIDKIIKSISSLKTSYNSEIQQTLENNNSSFRLHFNPGVVDESGEKAEHLTLGNVSVFTAMLVQAMFRSCSKQKEHPFIGTMPETVNGSIANSITASHVLQIESIYVSSAELKSQKLDKLGEMIEQAINDAIDSVNCQNSGGQRQGGPSEATNIVKESSIPITIEPHWSILRQSVQHRHEAAALKVARMGVSGTFNKNDHSSITSPLLQVGSTVFVDRQEIEEIRTVQHLMLSHQKEVINAQFDPLGKKTLDRPLSIALFGPPGSGKSYVVKKIIEKFQEGSDGKLFPFEKMGPYNLSTYSSASDLDKDLRKIANRCVEKVIPVAFFDEFDSSVGKPFSWLHSFLGPMEDGVIEDDRSIKSAILVFAGGTSPTFSKFCMESQQKTSEQYRQFEEAKGPDFTSRLDGFLDIAGINPTSPSDGLYLIRRAIMIHSILAKHGAVVGDAANVDENLLKALMLVPEYKHGARSLRKLIQMCLDRNNRASVALVPPVHQLGMLVDAKSFMSHL